MQHTHTPFSLEWFWFVYGTLYVGMHLKFSLYCMRLLRKPALFAGRKGMTFIAECKNFTAFQYFWRLFYLPIQNRLRAIQTGNYSKFPLIRSILYFLWYSLTNLRNFLSFYESLCSFDQKSLGYWKFAKNLNYNSKRSWKNKNDEHWTFSLHIIL